MSVDMNKAHTFVYQNGTLFERALFAFLFRQGSSDRVQQIALCYKNPDNGFGHGFEHDLLAPQSNPLALEYLLSTFKHVGVPIGNLLDGVADWVERQMNEDGYLKNPPETREYPMAWWWQERGGQNMPDSIVANLIYFGVATPSLIEKTKKWVENYYTLEKIQSNEWLFMAYHAFDFFFVIEDFPNLEMYQQAVIENIITCAEKAPPEQYDSLFSFAPKPDSMIAKALPDGLINRYLNHLETTQQEGGEWRDQHELPQWYPMATINSLLALKRYGRLEKYLVDG